MSRIITLNYIHKIGIEKTIYNGRTGKNVYLLKNGYKFKEFPEEIRNLDDEDNLFLYNSLLEQTHLSLKTISTPEKIVMDKESLCGYIAPYEQGVELKDIDPLFLIEKLLQAIHELEEDIKTLSDEGWGIYDLHDKNILIKTQTPFLKVIDTDCYIKTKENNYKANMTAIFNTIIYAVIPRIQLSKEFHKKLIQKYYYYAAQGLMKTSEFLEYLLSDLKQYVLSSFTVEDLRTKIR